MSDYLPPGTTLNINHLPEECLRLIFLPLSVVSQLKAGQVCTLWRSVVQGIHSTKTALILLLGKSSKSYMFDEHNLKEADYHVNGLKMIKLTPERITSLVEIFPGITEMTIYSVYLNPLEPSIQQLLANLLTEYKKQLSSFTLASLDITRSFNGRTNSTRNGEILFDAINGLSVLKKLSLKVDEHTIVPLKHFDLPILKQLEVFKFDHKNTDANIVKLWKPHLEGRSTVMEISLTGGKPLREPFIAEITPKVASMFTQFPRFNVSLPQFRQLATRFTNLTHLQLTDRFQVSYAIDVPPLFHALSNLPKLTHLAIYSSNEYEFSNRPNANAFPLPRLTSVTNWLLQLDDYYFHVDLNRWMDHFRWVFPNLTDFTIRLPNMIGCLNCGYDMSLTAHDYIDCYDVDDVLMALERKKNQAEECIRRQLCALIQGNDCSKLTVPVIDFDQDQFYSNHSVTLVANCTLY